MTGRAAGYCAGYDAPGYANPVPGRGYGRGWGRGWFGGRGYGRGGGYGWRHRFYATGLPGWARYGYAPDWGYPPTPSKDQELEMLRNDAEWMKSQLDAINQRIKDIEAE